MSIRIFPTQPFLRFTARLVAGVSWRAFLVASLICSFWSTGYAAPEAGKAVAVVQSATATGENGERTLQAGMAVSIGDIIKTGRGGQVQLVFTDDTKLVVGPNSSLVIDTYLLRSKSIVDSFAVKALGGTFRVITGKSPKKAYSVRTPAAAIGIRGTSFDLAIRRRSTDLLLFSGEVDLCGTVNCVLLKDACSLANAPRNGDASLENSAKRRNRQINARFPYTVSQTRLLPEFRVSTKSCGDLQKAEFRHEPPGPREPREPRERREPEPPQDNESPPGEGVD